MRRCEKEEEVRKKMMKSDVISDEKHGHEAKEDIGRSRR